MKNYGFTSVAEGATQRICTRTEHNEFVLARKTSLLRAVHNPRHVEMSDNIRRVAFTLAEVLITLGIIGVVAAMTIPTLIADYNKRQTLSRVKQSYSLLAQAVKMSEVYNGDTNYWDHNQKTYDFFKQYIAPYLKDTKTVNKGEEQIKYYKPNNEESTSFTPLRETGEIIRLANGTDILVSNTEAGISQTEKLICFDINGYNQGPNRFGRDVFAASIKKGYGLIPYGLHESSDSDTFNDYDRDIITDSTLYGCNTTGGNGAYCLALLIYDGWEFKEDYPY